MIRQYHRFAGRAYWRGLGMMGREAKFFGPGEVRLALLSLLSERPSHGYELMRRLGQRSGGVYQASAGTIYPTLQQIDDEGLITSELREGKRVYSITDDGRKELESEAETVRRIWRRAEGWQEWGCVFDPYAAELRGPAERLVKAAFRAATGERGTRERLERIRKILERALHELERLGGREL